MTNKQLAPDKSVSPELYGKDTGVMLVGHGTRDSKGTQQFFQLGHQLTQLLEPTPVMSCLLEFQEPTIPQAWQSLVDQGCKSIHVAPLLLFAAGHAKQDIPNLVTKCQSSTPDVDFNQSGPLSRHPAIIELIGKRVAKTAADFDSASTALVMVGRGSHDPCAQADMRILTEVVQHRLRFSHSMTSFYAMAEPRLPAVLNRAATVPGVETIVVQPHLLFQGRLYDAIANQVAEAASRHPDKQFVLSGYLGPEIEIAQAIVDRISTA